VCAFARQVPMTLEQLRAQREALQFARFHGVRTVKAGHDTY